MDIVIKIMGIVLVFLAVLYLLKPDIMKSLMEFFKQGKRIYFAGLIRIVLAIVFLLAARECDITLGNICLWDSFHNIRTVDIHTRAEKA